MLRSFRPGLSVALLAIAGLGVACKKSTDAPVKVAAANAVLPMNTNDSKALTGEVFKFPTGAAVLFPSMAGQALTLSFSTPASGGATTASGTVTSSSGTVTPWTASVVFGSCTFNVTAPSNLAGTVFIQNCTATVNVAGTVVGSTTDRTATLNLNGFSSDPVTVSVRITSSGMLIVNDQPTVSVPLTDVSG